MFIQKEIEIEKEKTHFKIIDFFLFDWFYVRTEMYYVLYFICLQPLQLIFLISCTTVHSIINVNAPLLFSILYIYSNCVNIFCNWVNK